MSAATPPARPNCAANTAARPSWGADAVIGGVDTFQVLYGLDTDVPADGVANQYVSAGVLDALRCGAGAGRRATRVRANASCARRTHWKRIASIRVALVVHGARPARTGAEPEVFDLFGRAYSDALGAADRRRAPGRSSGCPTQLRRRERKLFASTVLLRNSLDRGAVMRRSHGSPLHRRAHC